MSIASQAGPSGIGATPQRQSRLRQAAIGACVAALVNVGLWAIGRAVDASFLVETPVREDALEIGIVEVVLTTLFAFAVGWGLLVLAVRRSRRLVRLVLGTAGVVAVVSAGGPLSAADDTTTGLLLAAMHLVTGTAFLVTASRAGRDVGTPVAADQP